jgi:endonuclease/exonuclease/phosphatase family metal-dependent hydrolase
VTTRGRTFAGDRRGIEGSVIIPAAASPRAARRRSAASIVLVLTTLFGVQAMRSLVSGAAMFLYEAEEVPAPVAAACVLAPVVLAAGLHRVLVLTAGTRHALVVTACGVACLRFAEQLSASPAADVVLAGACVALWICFLPPAVEGLAPVGGGRGLAFALLAAIAVDTAIKGAFATMDLSWVRDLTGFGLLAALVVVDLVALAACRPGWDGPRPRSAAATPLLAIGPVVAVELLVAQNVGRLTVDAGVAQERAFLVVSAGNAAGLLLVAAVPARVWARAPVGAALVTGAVLAWLSWSRPIGEWALLHQVVLMLLVAHLVSCVAIAVTDGSSPRPPTVWPAAAGVGAGLALVLGHAASHELALPVDRRLLLPLAVLLATVAVVPDRSRAVRPVPGGRAPALRAVAVLAGVVLLAVPLHRAASAGRPGAVPGAGLPLTVMTFNLHHGFDAGGRPSIERVADLIEQVRPDVVALQEVSRAWPVSGSFDMLEWLSRRLDMPYVWGPSVDGVWGNAVLTRLPVAHAETVPMVNNDELRLDRAFTCVDVEAGDGVTVRILATHLHAGWADRAQRLEQIRVLIDAVHRAGTRDVLLLGDLNFRQWDPEFDLLVAAGLTDAYSGSTTRANVRIDYIWTTGALRARNVVVGPGTASDHHPLSAEVFRSVLRTR